MIRLLPESEWPRVASMLAETGQPMPEEGEARIIVEEDARGKIVGLLQYQRVLHVGPLYVVPDERGKGVATNLARFCRDIFPDGTRAFVQSDAPEVEKIVEALGFEELKVRTFGKGVL